MKRRLPPAQLALPLDYSASVRGGPPQSPALSKRQRSRPLQAGLEANLATRGRLDTVPGSFTEYDDNNEFRQGQRFTSMSFLSTPTPRLRKSVGPMSPRQYYAGKRFCGLAEDAVHCPWTSGHRRFKAAHSAQINSCNPT